MIKKEKSSKKKNSSSKISTFYKNVKENLKLDYWIGLLIPLVAFVGVVAQISMLSQYNAVPLFSWSQVFADSIILLPLVISGFLGFFSYFVFLKLKPTVWEEVGSFLSLFLAGFLSMLLLSIFNGFKVNNYLLGLFIFFFCGYLLHLTNRLTKINENKKGIRKFIYPSILYSLYFCCFSLCFFISSAGISYINQNIKIEIEKKEYDIKYMNDKYIIYGSGELIKNDDKVILKIKD